MDVLAPAAPPVQRQKRASAPLRLTADQEADQEIEHQFKSFWELRRQLIPPLGGTSQDDASADMEALRARLSTLDDFKRFVRSLWKLVVGSFPVCFPYVGKADRQAQVDGPTFFRQLTLARDVFDERRHADYYDLDHFARIWCNSESLTDEFDYYKAQQRLLGVCIAAFEDIERIMLLAEPLESKLSPNPCLVDPQERFCTLREKLGRLREGLVESSERPGVYPRDSRDEAVDLQVSLVPASEGSERWQQLREFAMSVRKLVFDCLLIDVPKRLWPSADVRDVLDMFVRFLRNWHAHGSTEKQDEINYCYKHCRKVLGRSSGRKGTLPLTPLEAVEIQGHIIENVNRFLNGLRELGPKEVHKLVERKKEKEDGKLLTCPHCFFEVDLQHVACSRCQDTGVKKLRSGEMRCQKCQEIQPVPCPRCHKPIPRWKY